MDAQQPQHPRRRGRLVVRLAFVGFLVFGFLMCAYAMSQYG